MTYQYISVSVHTVVKSFCVSATYITGFRNFSKDSPALDIIMSFCTRARVCVCCFRTQEKYQSDPDSYNGAVRENYSWSQDYTDVEVRVFVPKTIVKGRQVNTVYPIT